MVEETTIIKGNGVNRLPEIIKEHYSRAQYRHFESMHIILLENKSYFWGSSNVVAIICNLINDDCCRLYILNADNWFIRPRRTSVRRYKKSGEVFNFIQSICDSNSWEIEDIYVMT